MNISFVLLFIGIIIVSCVLLNNFSNKTGFPMLLAFMVLGMIFGSDGLMKIQFNDFQITKEICTVALIFIIFYGGFGTRWLKAKPIVLKSALLATVSVVLTAGLTGLFCHFVLRMPTKFSFLVGAVLSSTDAASVFSILRSKKLGLKHNTASLLEMESGSNDPASYMLTIIMISIIMGDLTSGWKILYMIFAQLVYGAAFGVGIALLAIWIMKRFKAGNGFDSIFVFAVAIFAYALPDLVGGNGYLSAYIVGIMMGNANIRGKKELVGFFDGINGLMQVIIFFLLGLLCNPSELPKVALPAIAIAVFMTLIARPISVVSILAPFKCPAKQQALVSFVGLRGAASIVFAIMATPAATMLVGNEHTLFNIVFTIVLLSISVQGSLIPFTAKKLKMIDKNEDIMKTFTDYIEETDVQFIKLKIDAHDRWNGALIKELKLPNDTLIALIIRDGKALIPNGKTKIHEGDSIIMSGKDFEDHNYIHLIERKIPKDSEWVGKKIFQYSPFSDELIVLIRRGDETIIPRGNTIIEKNDIMIVNKVSSFKA